MNEQLNTALTETSAFINSLHFIRADWFYAFIPLLIFLLLAYKTASDQKNWASVIDPVLAPFVLTKTVGRRRRYPLVLIFIASSLCITALAGPVYKKLPQPVYREQSSLVVLLDLSLSMDATDIKPSRLSRAKLELLDLLKTRKTGETALIVYAADAFVVTPLTDDNATIANLVPSLTTDMMPAQGSNLSSALRKTFSLFTQAGVINGHILVITDGIHSRNESAIKGVTSQGHSLSIFGIGTASGGPIPLNENRDGGFLQDRAGAIVIPKLLPAKLQRYALSGAGLYTSLQADDSDIEKLTSLFKSTKISQDSKKQDINADAWQEEGYWLLLPLLFFAALWTRKGWINSLLPIALIVSLSSPQTAHAANDIFDPEQLWLSHDQKAMKAFNAGDIDKAAEEFRQPDWKASALYRKGDYQGTVETLHDTKNSDGFYNRGNALARLDKYKEAIAAYDEALALDENNVDAKYNREQVKNVLQKQEEQNKNKQGESSDDASDENQDKQQQDGQQKSEQPNDPSDENQTDGDQSKNNQPSSEQKKAEEEQLEKELKQRDAKAEEKKQQEEKQRYQHDENNQKPDDADKDNNESDEIQNKDSDDDARKIEINPMEASLTEEEKATEQWLKRIPDDPGGLLRRKFYYQYKQIPNQRDDIEPW